jgi:hypothetical protein
MWALEGQASMDVLELLFTKGADSTAKNKVVHSTHCSRVINVISSEVTPEIKYDKFATSKPFLRLA